MSAEHDEYVAPFLPRRAVRFFAFRIRHDAQIWLEGTDRVMNVEQDGDGWVVTVMEEGPIQRPLDVALGDEELS